MKKNSAIAGAAFLMATSAIGPGFLNNTSRFTADLLSSFGFVIFVSVIIDICVQLNIWRIVTVSGMRAQDIANSVAPGLGYLLAAVVAFGGLAFNVGNIAGCGLGLQSFSGLDARWGGVASCIVAILIFWIRDAGRAMDVIVKWMGLAMILLTIYVMVRSTPPYLQAFTHTLLPEKINFTMIVALVGGTVGGYICFAGAHRLADAGITGVENISRVTRSAVTGISITAVMRYILFLAALGVVSGGVALSVRNPAASVFSVAGKRVFGLVMWLAAITSVVGAAYTSVSFLKTLHKNMERYQRWIITGFIIVSTVIFELLQKPPGFILVSAGVLNGFILPVALGILLFATMRSKHSQYYHHPKWLTIAGWLVVGVLCWMSIVSLV